MIPVIVIHVEMIAPVDQVNEIDPVINTGITHDPCIDQVVLPVKATTIDTLTNANRIIILNT